jgi:hypothetical protein
VVSILWQVADEKCWLRGRIWLTKISKVAAEKGFAAFGMTHNLLELAISAEEMGASLEKTVDNH